jgi:AcrR family transcriptional regulator
MAARRVRPPSEHARLAALTAARALLEAGGPGAVTMDAVAAEAGVGKPTLYRHWPDRHALTMAALMHASEAQTITEDRSTALSKLQKQLEAIVDRFATGVGRHVASLLAASDPESELAKAFRNHFILARVQEGRSLVERAVASGDLRADIDRTLLIDMLYGAVFFRLLLGHEPLTHAFVKSLMAHLKKAYGKH